MQQQQTSASAVSGMLLGPLTSSVQPVVSTAASTAQAATIASGALDLFAKAVDEYNDGIDRLNERYEARWLATSASSRLPSLRTAIRASQLKWPATSSMTRW